MDNDAILSEQETDILDNLQFMAKQVDPDITPFLEQAHFLLAYALSVGAIETAICPECKEVGVKSYLSILCRHGHRNEYNWL